jgi:dihydropyrimidine dehydrogenase (NAD+) subunit PreA
VLVKLTPNVTDIVEVARAAQSAGAAGVTAINNLRCLAGVDIERMEPLPPVAGFSSFGGYAGPGLKPVGLRCVAEVAQSLAIPVAGTGGIRRWQDVVEYILVGASIVQVYTLIMEQGYDVIEDLVAGLTSYLGRKGITQVSDLVGAILPKIVPHSQLPRNTKPVAAYSPQLCTQCGQCIVACDDAGFQAVELGPNGLPRIDTAACDGCGLCVVLCPVEDCMWLQSEYLC